MNWYKRAQPEKVDISEYISRANRYISSGITGDCGMFAIALHKVLEEQGDNSIFGICVNRNYDHFPSLKELSFVEDDYNHIILIYNNKFYDIEGETSIDKIQAEYFDDYAMAVLTYDFSEELENFIRNNTDYSNHWQLYYNAMKQDELV